MPKDSLRNLLDMFPYFFKKDEDSNFFKSQKVTNNLLKKVYQSLFDTKESFRLGKRCIVWKEQHDNYDYVIRFVANFEYLKSVTLLKNDNVIYTETFPYTSEITNFDYSHNDSTLNNIVEGEDAPLIPQDTFIIQVETYTENTITKGFPENDEPLGNEYDHDESLDEIGALHNIPRKEYLKVSEDHYPLTEPPYNDRLTEDDYHYMKRIIEYLYRVNTQPLPVAEIWKLYGIESTMENREKLIIKFFDLEKHPNFIDDRKDGKGEYIKDGDRWFSGTLDEETGEIIEWTPQKWEHLDKFCDNDILGAYFFVKTSTRQPIKGQSIILYFYFLNSLSEKLPGVHLVDIEVNGVMIQTDYSGDSFEIPADLINSDDTNIIRVVGKTEDGVIIGSEELTVETRGCESADFYVSPNGSDNNDGKSSLTPFRTIQKAVNKVNGNQNLIAVLQGDYILDNPVMVTQSCVLLGCGGVSIENEHTNIFFKVHQDITVYLHDFTFIYDELSAEIDTMSVTNNNTNDSLVDILLDSDQQVVLVPIQTIMANYTHIITDISYVDNKVKFSRKLASNVTKLSDLNNAVMNLRYVDNKISFDRFQSQSSHSELDRYEVNSLNGILVGLSYVNGVIKFEKITIE